MPTDGTTRTYLHPFGPGLDPAVARPPRAVLGAKGEALDDLARGGFPVPPGFTVSTEAVAYAAQHQGRWPAGLAAQLREQVARLERLTGRRLGDARAPLLLAVRRGGGPGVVLNLGATDKTLPALARLTGSDAAAWECARIFLEQFGAAVLGLKPALFEQERERILRKYKLDSTAGLRADQTQEMVEAYQKAVLPRAARPCPDHPFDQLELALEAAVPARENSRLAPPGPPARRPPALHVQVMVLGNLGPDSGSGTAFGRDPVGGDFRPVVRLAVGRPGTEVAADTALRRLDEAALPPEWGPVRPALEEMLARLEVDLRHPQEVDFTVERGVLWLLQTQPARREPGAGLRWAVEMTTGRDSQTGKSQPIRWTARQALDTLGAADLRACLAGTPRAATPRKGRKKDPPAAAGRVHPFARLLRQVSEWSDERRELRVLAVPDLPSAAPALREAGADGIGGWSPARWLTQGDRLWLLREMLWEEDAGTRAKRLARLVPGLRAMMETVLSAFPDGQVHLRLPDIEPARLLPQSDREWKELGRRLDQSPTRLQESASAWQGLHGARALLAQPELIATVVRAGIEAAAGLESGRALRPQGSWCIPGVTSLAETEALAGLIRATAEATRRTVRSRADWPVGLLVQTPRAALLADQLAQHASWFCFDLAEITRGLHGWDRTDPAVLDPTGRPFDSAGTGALLQNAIRQARLARPDAVFGAWVGPASDVSLFRQITRTGMNFVCVDGRDVQVARLLAAQASGRGDV